VSVSPLLIVFAGLPGVGKSSIAQQTARALQLPWLSVDPIESALLQSGIDPGQPTGLAAYAIAQTLADAQLSLGQSLIVDAVNAAEEARAAWRTLAARHGAALRIIECVCSDLALHRQRLEARRRGLFGLREPTWESVERRRAESLPWTGDRLVLDTVEPLAQSLARVRAYLGPGTAPRS
jgi:predicted kinase